MTAAPADWYPSPKSPDLLQYWDGEMWTDRMRPAAKVRTPQNARQEGHVEDRVLNSPIVSALLEHDEWIVAGFNGKSGLRSAMFIATDRRVLLLKSRTFRGTQITDLAFSEIARVDGGMVAYTVNESGVRLRAHGRDHLCMGGDFPAMAAFCDYVRERIAGGRQPPPPSLSTPPPPQPEVDDFIDRLERISTLRARGALSDAEFIEAKAKLLRE